MSEAKPKSDKCLKHQCQPTTRRCRLCDAKKEANGKTELAKKIYIKKDYANE